MRILVTNDDGILSPGLHVLASVAAEFGHVQIVAPSGDRSSGSHAVTTRQVVRHHRVNVAGIEGYAVDGTPADCVSLGVCWWNGVDLVLSGINPGPNLGHEIWYSGTVAAARQARLVGVARAAAISLAAGGRESSLKVLIPWVRNVLQLILRLPTPLLVNVNIPSEPRGLRWTRQAVEGCRVDLVPGTDPHGNANEWIAVRPLTTPDMGTDRWAVENRWVALTPLRVDLTDEGHLRTVAEIQGALATVASTRDAPALSRGGTFPSTQRPAPVCGRVGDRSGDPEGGAELW